MTIIPFLCLLYHLKVIRAFMVGISDYFNCVAITLFLITILTLCYFFQVSLNKLNT